VSRQSAASLVSFVEGISQGGWRAPASITDRRSFGVIVHHVASAYPVEIDLARTIASGKAVTDVTWEVVAELNARHAKDHAGITKEAALELLRRNSCGAAAAVRAFTDEELDRAAPFSLSYGAPVTAQFVIEDHQFGTAGITWRAFAQPWGDDLCVCTVPLRELLPVGVKKSSYHVCRGQPIF
jgi:hypothetical protein